MRGLVLTLAAVCCFAVGGCRSWKDTDPPAATIFIFSKGTMPAMGHIYVELSDLRRGSAERVTVYEGLIVAYDLTVFRLDPHSTIELAVYVDITKPAVVKETVSLADLDSARQAVLLTLISSDTTSGRTEAAEGTTIVDVAQEIVRADYDTAHDGIDFD